jgi:hypothetical protein
MVVEFLAKFLKIFLVFFESNFFLFKLEKFMHICKLNDFNLDVQLLLEASKSGDLEVVKVRFKSYLKCY